MAVTYPRLNQMQLTERALGPNEQNLVLATWIKAFRTSPYAGCLPNHVSTSILTRCIVDLLDAGATLRGVFDEYDNCLGWVCEDLTEDSTPVIHYIYTRPRQSEASLAEVRASLVPASGGIYTYRTKDITDFLGFHWKHRPGIARARSNKHEQ